ncbi:hypothetical protein EYF80_035780 [Liparis tanakae]|uniref:Uncharacterized protein n=1 Tax=Liparis tanakae TaxID=230148 RepID=A0A4Z2GMX8_9TELE|nr:hypothetical protein EYF80_035780 [Liparis tanakae]
MFMGAGIPVYPPPVAARGAPPRRVRGSSNGKRERGSSWSHSGLLGEEVSPWSREYEGIPACSAEDVGLPVASDCCLMYEDTPGELQCEAAFA